MKWNPHELVDDFIVVAKLAGVTLGPGSICIETLSMPHKPPSNLPKGKMAVYVFSEKDRILKVGKVGQHSEARYTSQHYNSGSAPSTLAASLLNDEDSVRKYRLVKGNVSCWIKGNTDRVNLIVDADFGTHTLTLLEAFVQCRLQPLFERVPNQRRLSGRRG